MKKLNCIVHTLESHEGMKHLPTFTIHLSRTAPTTRTPQRSASVLTTAYCSGWVAVKAKAVHCVTTHQLRPRTMERCATTTHLQVRSFCHLCRVGMILYCKLRNLLYILQSTTTTKVKLWPLCTFSSNLSAHATSTCKAHRLSVSTLCRSVPS